MTGIALPGGVTLYGDGDSPDVCGAPDGQGIALPGGVTMYGLGLCEPLDPLLAEFAWLADARYDRTNRMTDQINGTVATHGSPQADNTGGYAFSGTALVGQMELTAGTNTGDWFTDLDFRWEAGLLEHVQILTDGAHPLQILFIPAVDTSVAWLEVNFQPQANGDVLVFLDAGGDGNAGADRFNWTSTVSVGQWDQDGVAVYNGRLTVAGGAVTLYTEDEIVDSGTASAPHVFNEPPDGSVVWAGGSTSGARPIRSFELLDGIDGDPIISFDADDPTGWESVTGTPTTSATRSAYVGEAPGAPFTFASSATYDLPANTDTAVVIALRPLTTADSTYMAGRNLANLGGAPAWALIHLDAFGGYIFAISDGSDTVPCSLGTIGLEDQIVVANIDRATDRMTTYVNGVQTDQQNIAAVGAVDAGTVSLALNVGWLYTVGQINRVLTGPERGHLQRVIFG